MACAVVALAFSLMAGAVHPTSGDPSTRTAPAASQDWSSSGWFGIGSARVASRVDGSQPGHIVAVYGLDFVRRAGSLQFGVSTAMTHAPTGDGHSYSVFGLGGLRISPTSYAQLDLFAELGVNAYGDPSFGHDSDEALVSDTWTLLPNFGLRASLSGRFGRPRRYLMGVWIMGRKDLVSRSISAPRGQCAMNGSACPDLEASGRFGGVVLAAGVRIGLEF